MTHPLMRARAAALALLVFVSQTALAVKFTQREFKFQSPAKAPITLDLKTVLKELSPGQGLRFEVHNLPGWLNYDETTFRITGVAPTTTPSPERFGVEVFQGSTSDFAFFEYATFAPPKWKQAIVDLGTQFEGQPFTLDLRSFLQSERLGSLSFSATNLPFWMSLSSDGMLSGIPNSSNLGTYTGIVLRVDGPFGTYATAGAGGEVRRAPIWPKWTKDAITIEDAVEDVLYEKVLAEFVSNPDNLALSFRLIPGKHPAWINITNQGKLFGIPRRAHVGPATVEVSLSAVGASVTQAETVKFTFQVLRTNKAPLWKSDPVELPKALQGNAYLADLSNYVDDPDLPLGDGLFLEILSGPTWATIAPPALFRGTPPTNQVGVQTWRVRVTDVAGLSAIATVQTEILKANLPPVLQKDLKFTIKERTAVSEDLAKYATDAEGETISFEGVNLPTWVSLTPAGKLLMNPQHADVGDHTISVRLADGNSKSLSSFQIAVQADPKPPIWIEDPVRIDAISGVAFAVSVADKVHDPDGGAVSFAKVSGPAWLAMDAAGRVGGLPKDADVGEAKFILSAKNAVGEATVSLLVRVRQGNRPPQWSQDPLSLTAAKINVPFTFDLGGYVKDADGDLLRFTKILAPGWLRITSDGKLGGTPSAADTGEFAAVFEVTDGKYAVQVGAKGRVGDGNLLPTIKSGALAFSVKQKDIFTENLAQAKYVEDADGDPLSFSALNFPAWAKLSAQGALELKPTETDGGTHSLRIEVSDGKGRVQGVLTVRVAKDPRPPVWLEDPVQVTTLPNQPVNVNLANKVQEFDGLALTFQKVSGPTWLNVTTNGVASGTPSANNSGVNTFVISASSPNGTVEGSLKVNVRAGFLVQMVSLEGKSPSVEVLWAVDPQARFLSSFYSSARDLYAGLAADGVSVSSAVLSSREFDGRLLTDNAGEPLLVRGPASDVAADLRQRVERAPTGKNFNSPIWALSRLYDENPKGSSRGQVKSGYWSDGVPMEVFVLSGEGDYYPTLAAQTSKANWGANEYFRSFTTYHGRGAQPFTVSVYDLRCPAAYNPSNPAVRPAFLSLVTLTMGTYFYQDASCADRVLGAVKTFQQEASFRAQVFSNRRIKLDAPALSTGPKVQLEHGTLIDLPGNTGASDDTWTYEKATGEIVIQWNKVRTRVQPGDRLKIRY